MKYKRVLLKLSGEMLKGNRESGVDGKVLMELAQEVKGLVEMGCEVGMVIGGGNIWRYRDNQSLSFNRVTSDTMGMMATVMNALAFEAGLKSIGVDVAAFSCLHVPKALDDYSPKKALDEMNKGKVCLFAGGTGHPYFTTDSAAALRALEMDCDVLLKATNVDFVYDKDPNKFDDAVKLSAVTYKEVIKNELGVMDLTCASLLHGQGVEMVVFNIGKRENLKKIILGESVGTVVN